MIPGVMKTFLACASLAVGTTRDARLVPRVHWVSGWRVDDEGTGIVCLIAKGFTGGLLEALGDNGRFAMNAERIGPHECYQFKGRYLDDRPLGPGDLELYEACRERFVTAIKHHTGERFEDAALWAWIREPELAIRFEVQEIFVQTPGPAAGSRLYPREDA